MVVSVAHVEASVSDKNLPQTPLNSNPVVAWGLLTRPPIAEHSLEEKVRHQTGGHVTTRSEFRKGQTAAKARDAKPLA
jgi:hypothetical protein